MNSSARYDSLGSLSSMLMLGFRYLAWLNGLGLLFVVCCALGIISTDFSPGWLRLPLLAFSGGVLFSGLALLWAYLAQVSLHNQAIAGYTRRTHWVPLTCTIVAYCLGLACFLAGCWLLVYAASVNYQSSNTDDPSASDEMAPYSQKNRGQFRAHAPVAQDVFQLR
jgi:hypothetical protein